MDHSSTSPAPYSHLYSPSHQPQRYQAKSPVHQALQTLLHKRTNFSENIQSRSSSVDIGEAFQALSIKSNTPLQKRAILDEVIHPRALSVAIGEADDEKSCYFSSSGITDLYNRASSFKKAKVDNQSWSDVPTDSSSGSYSKPPVYRRNYERFIQERIVTLRLDLKDEVLPILERLKEVADRARHLKHNQTPPPSHFKCPLLKEVIQDPCVAADGYTYDRKAIESWLMDNDNSPVTNLPLPHKHLLPNYALLSAIKEWKSGKH